MFIVVSTKQLELGVDITSIWGWQNSFSSPSMYVVENVEMNTQGSYNWNWIDACARLEGFLFMTFSYYRSWIEGRSNNKADMMTSWKRKCIQGAHGCTSRSHGRSHFLKPGDQWCSHWSNGNRHQQNPSVKPNLSFSRADSRRELPTQAMQLH